MRPRALALINPISGRGRGASARGAIVEAFAGLGWDAEAVLLAGPGDATSRVTREGADYGLLAAVGGDGTINEVARGVHVAGLSVPVAVIPLGLSNCLARHFGIGSDVISAVRTAVVGRRVPWDLALAGVHAAVAFLGAGFDAAVVERVARNRSGPIKDRDYVNAALASLKPAAWPRLIVAVDGRRLPETFYQAILCSVINYAHYFRVPPAEGARLYLFAGRRPTSLVRSLWRWRGLRDLARAADRVLAVEREIRISVADGMGCYQVDGERGGALPVTVTLARRALTFMAPAG